MTRTYFGKRGQLIDIMKKLLTRWEKCVSVIAAGKFYFIISSDPTMEKKIFRTITISLVARWLNSNPQSEALFILAAVTELEHMNIACCKVCDYHKLFLSLLETESNYEEQFRRFRRR